MVTVVALLQVVFLATLHTDRQAVGQGSVRRIMSTVNCQAGTCQFHLSRLPYTLWGGIVAVSMLYHHYQAL